MRLFCDLNIVTRNFYSIQILEKITSREEAVKKLVETGRMGIMCSIKCLWLYVLLMQMVGEFKSIKSTNKDTSKYNSHVVLSLIGNLSFSVYNSLSCEHRCINCYSVESNYSGYKSTLVITVHGESEESGVMLYVIM